MKTTAYPRWAFELWGSGAGDVHVATDKDIDIPSLKRFFWRVRGEILMFCFGWWWWK